MISDAKTASELRNDVVRELDWRLEGAKRKRASLIGNGATKVALNYALGKEHAFAEELQCWKDMIVEGRRWEPEVELEVTSEPGGEDA
jgi:hypothetical protein